MVIAKVKFEPMHCGCRACFLLYYTASKYRRGNIKWWKKWNSILTKQLQCARNYAYYFAYKISFNSNNNPSRLSVITFHSLEDRIVKQIFKKYSEVDEVVKGLPQIPDEYKPLIKLVNRKPILPTDEELEVLKVIWPSTQAHNVVGPVL